MRKLQGYTRGINFGGWFSQCDHSQKRYDYFIRREDFRRVKDWGLDHVRIPVDYELLLDKDLKYREDGFQRIENCIRWCEEYGLHMILDLHKTLGFSFDAGEREEGFFESEALQNVFYHLWREIAKRFGSHPHVAFELLNEITDEAYSAVWNEITKTAVKKIREYAPHTLIFIGGYHNNSIEAVKDLDAPYDEYVVHTFHCYSPLIFTHQGAYWIPSMDTSFRLPFDADASEYRKHSAEQIHKGYSDMDALTEDHVNAGYFERMFIDTVKLCEERDVPLYCGEYGVIDNANAEDTLKWLSCIHETFEKHNIGRALWSYKEMDFGLVDAHYDPVRDEMIKRL